jgi:spore maturation protein CgeB
VRIDFFGSSLVSSYWNGAATYYRGLVRALHARGHEIVFYEPDAYDRQAHRDIADPDWAAVIVYEPEAWEEMLERARDTDVLVKASGVGVNDDELEAAVPSVGAPVTVFWDVDAPATLARVEADPDDPFRAALPGYDFVLTYGGGEPIVERYRALGARDCVPVYNALDPETHHPARADRRFSADVAFLGNRLPDREARVEAFFLGAAEHAPQRSFLLGGAGWDDRPLPRNVRLIGHVPTTEHNAFNSTPLAVLNVSRESMAANGWSPATRIFEAAGAGACLITDEWTGIELFLEPDEEILVARDGADVAALVERLTPERAEEIGRRALRRVLAEHTYERRAELVEEVLSGVRA